MFSALLFAAAAFSLILATQVITSDVKNRANLAFFLLLILNGLYSVLMALFLSIEKLTQSITFARLLFAVSAPFPVVFYFFCQFFRAGNSERSGLRLLSTHGVMALIIAGVCFSSATVKGIAFSQLGPRPVYGPLFPLYVAYFLIYLSLGVRVLIRRLITSSGFDRVRIKYALLGIVPGFCLIILCAMILPLVGVVRFSQLGPVLTLPMLGVLTYAIVRHRVLDLTAFSRRILSFTASVGISGLIVSTLTLMIFRYLSDSADADPYILVPFSTILTAMVTYSARRSIESIVDKQVFRQSSNYRRSLYAFRKQLPVLRRHEELAAHLANGLKHILGARSVTVVYWISDVVPETFFFSTENNRKPPTLDALLEARLLLEQRGDLVVLDEAIQGEDQPVRQRLEELFRELSSAVLIRLGGAESVTGLIGVGEKTFGDMYSADEIEFLMEVGQQVSVAMENATLFAKVMDAKDYIRTVFDQLTCGVITVDHSGLITEINKTACDMLGLTRENAIGQSSSVLQPRVRQVLETTVSRAAAVIGEEMVLHTDEGSVWRVSLSSTVLRDLNGCLVGAVVVITDLTEIKLLEAEVRRVERLATVGTLAAGMAHEIKNPLVSLKTFAQLLPQKYDDPEFREIFSQIASAEIERINSLVEQLLRFAWPPKPILMPIDLHEPVEQTLNLLSTEIAKKGISVERRYHKAPLLVFADSEQLKQVFMNVLLNAVDVLGSTPEPRLEVTTGVRRKWGWPVGGSFANLPQGYTTGSQEAWVKIADNGPGIRENHLKHVFDPFFTTKDTGHGLGLSIAHGIVREHKGSITAENVARGGAAFTVALPLLEHVETKERGEADELRADRLA